MMSEDHYGKRSRQKEREEEAESSKANQVVRMRRASFSMGGAFRTVPAACEERPSVSFHAFEIAAKSLRAPIKPAL